MLTYVLDASAAIRFVDSEAGSVRIRELLTLAKNGSCAVVISSVNWGEIAYILDARKRTPALYAASLDLFRHTITIVSASAERAVHAGLLKNEYNIAYADAFGVELATDSPDHILVTADYGVKPAEQDIRIEFLPAKLKS